MLWLLTACTDPSPPTEPPAYTYPAPDARPALRGPGGPSVSYTDDELFENCAFLVGADEDRGYRNTIVPWRGHMLMPWAWELGSGGLSFYEMDDPCNPVHAHYGLSAPMRETHALGMVHLPEGDPHAGDYAVANAVRGLVFWDMTDLDDIHETTEVVLQDVVALDSYARTAFSVSWQYPYVFLAATDNGLLVLDATDPSDPFEVARFQLDPLMRMGGVFVHGSSALVVSAGQQEAAMLDLSDPLDPQLISRFTLTDGEGTPREAYSGNRVGEMALFARKDNGSGLLVYDLSDPGDPVFRAEYPIPEGGGGYVFYDEGAVFVGSGSRADVFDVTNLDAIAHVGTGHLEGDLDTITPFGNIAILSVDDEGVEDQESAVMPWSREPDSTPPLVLSVNPPDGAVGVATTARIGVAFNEMIEPSSVFAGSVQLHGPDGAIEAWAGAQESFGWFTPKRPLEPDTQYTLTVPANGVVDINSNALATETVSTFTTGSR